MGGDHLDDLGLLRAPALLEVPCGSEVPGLLLLAGERVVCDPLDEGLQKAVVPALRRTWVRLEREEVPAHKRGENRPQLVVVHARQRRQARLCEGLAEHGGVFDNPALYRLEAVEPRCDQRVQRLRDLQGLDVASEQAAVDQHADGFHRVERDALCALADAGPQLLGKIRDEPCQQVVNRLVRERLERNRREVTLGPAPTGATL